MAVAMSKPKQTHKQTALRRLPSRGARFFLAEVEQGRLTLTRLLDVKKQYETNPMFVGAMAMEVAQAFGGVAPHGVTEDALRAYHADVCEAITLLTAREASPLRAEDEVDAE